MSRKIIDLTSTVRQSASSTPEPHDGQVPRSFFDLHADDHVTALEQLTTIGIGDGQRFVGARFPTRCRHRRGTRLEGDHCFVSTVLYSLRTSLLLLLFEAVYRRDRVSVSARRLV